MRTCIYFLLAIELCTVGVSAAILKPRSPKGGSGGGHGGGGGGGRGGSSGARSGSSGASGAGRGGSGDTGHAAVSYGTVNTGGRSANYFGSGGGRPIILSDASTFHGRQMGGGVRDQVPGTRTYGSGYTYDSAAAQGNSVSGRGFPFGFWPVYWGGHGHSDEYGANETIASQRPGGPQAIVQLVPNATISTWDTTGVIDDSQAFYMFGDSESLATLLSILIDSNSTDTNGCGVQNLTVSAFNSSDPASLIRFENVIQWYRSSSFGLAYTGYNNSFALPPLNETATISWNDSTPLPSQLENLPFLQCINNTITAALPILDGEPPALSQSQITGIIIGCVFGAPILLCILCCCISRCRRSMQESSKRKEKEKVEKARQLAWEKRSQPERATRPTMSAAQSAWTTFPSSPASSTVNVSPPPSARLHRPALVLITSNGSSTFSSRTELGDSADWGEKARYYK